MAEVLARESVQAPLRAGAAERLAPPAKRPVPPAERLAPPDERPVPPAERLAPPDERLARAELRRQIGRLELELSRLTLDGFGRVGVPNQVAAGATPRLLDLGELERLRDSLAERAGEARAALAARAATEAANSDLLRALIESPGDYRWVRVSRADLGLPGCGHWHSRPRLGPIGMLMGWWRVKVSSGCPLAGRLAAAFELEVEAPPGQEAAAEAGRSLTVGRSRPVGRSRAAGRAGAGGAGSTRLRPR